MFNINSKTKTFELAVPAEGFKEETARQRLIDMATKYGMTQWLFMPQVTINGFIHMSLLANR